MKHALILEKDSDSARKIVRVLGWLGYTSAPAKTPDQAMNAVSAIKFDLIITCAAKSAHERRALTGELKRLAPEAVVILVRDTGEHVSHCPGISAVIERPPSYDVLRSIVEFGIDGCGLQMVHMPIAVERRRSVK